MLDGPAWSAVRPSLGADVQNRSAKVLVPNGPGNREVPVSGILETLSRWLRRSALEGNMDQCDDVGIGNTAPGREQTIDGLFPQFGRWRGQRWRGEVSAAQK